MAKCIIVGGGLAGLSAAVYLSKNGHQIELIDSSPKLGGRTYSFFNEKFNSEVDNGQHLLMGSYKLTLEFLKLINAFDKLEFQDNLKIVYINTESEKFKIDASKYFYPLNLLNAIWNFNALNLNEKFHFINFVISIPFISNSKLEKLTVAEWLKNNKQSENAIKSFWANLTVSALNTNIEDASAILFKNMLLKIFFTGNKSSTILIPKDNLSKIFVEPTLEYLNKMKFSYSVSEKLESIKIENNSVKEIKTNKRTLTQFDNLVLAIPYHQISKIKCNEKLLESDFGDYDTSAIISVNLKLKENIFTEKFISLIDSQIHWVFNHEEFITLVISDANSLIQLSQNQIIEICITELQKYFSDFNKNLITDSFVIKEKRATIKSNLEFENFRSKIEAKISNVFFIGDWTNTGLPQTIESAIYSGMKAANQIKK
ncbi:MAG: oleate hydratase [Ignavibacteriae bacterium]|nr:oleate hydratase [Ignavibacteriota bacterium]